MGTWYYDDVLIPFAHHNTGYGVERGTHGSEYVLVCFNHDHQSLCRLERTGIQ